MLAVVSGQMVVHCESVNARITTLPRNWRSDIGWPNWLTSRKPGAGPPLSEVPVSRSGFAAAAARACPPGACAAGFAVPVTLVPHAATPSSPARKPIQNRSHDRIRIRGRAVSLLPSTAVILPCARARAGVLLIFRTADPYRIFIQKGRDRVPKKYRNFSPEFREEAARMVIETSRAIADVARELGISETSLGNWVRAYREKHAEDEPPLQLSERARLRELERENRELRMKAEFLSKAAAYFAREHR
jgi:transposase